MDQLSTGLKELDDRLGGGIPSGSRIVIEHPPHGPGELFGLSLGTTPRGVSDDGESLLCYLSSAASERRIEQLYEQMKEDRKAVKSHADLLVEHIPPTGHRTEDKGLHDKIGDFSERVRDEAEDYDTLYLVVDGLSDYRLGDGIGVVVELLFDIVREENAVGYYFLHRDSGSVVSDVEAHTMRLADGVFQFQVGDDQNTLRIPSLRRASGNRSGFPFEARLDSTTYLAIDSTESA
jgi:KaiC/GvpD/RAD55 family RecA-like ATPase